MRGIRAVPSRVAACVAPGGLPLTVPWMMLVADQRNVVGAMPCATLLKGWLYLIAPLDRHAEPRRAGGRRFLCCCRRLSNASRRRGMLAARGGLVAASCAAAEAP